MAAAGVPREGLLVEAVVQRRWAYARKAPADAIRQRTRYACPTAQTNVG